MMFERKGERKARSLSGCEKGRKRIILVDVRDTD